MEGMLAMNQLVRTSTAFRMHCVSIRISTLSQCTVVLLVYVGITVSNVVMQLVPCTFFICIFEHFLSVSVSVSRQF